MKKKIFSLILACLLLLNAAVWLAGCGGDDGKIVIKVDGGGAFAGYNSSISMTPSDANPYPYNTLEQLAEEYNALHPEVRVEINRSSYDGARDSLIPLLSQGNAPDIIYQNGTVATEDLGKNWYVVMNDYYEQPNPYVEGNEHWKDIFNAEELAATQSPDGNYYFVCVDRVVNGMIYNKSLFEEAGITEEPETFKEFMDCLEKLDAIGTIPYLSGINNYDLFIESNLFNSILDQVDVIRPNGIADYEELARAVEKGIFQVDSPIFKDYLTLLLEKTKYYPSGFEGYDVFNNFIHGNVAIVEANGPLMMQTARSKSVGFEIGYFPFPYLTTDSCPEGSAYAGKPVIGGSAGLSSAWWVTNTAVNKGQEAVDAAVDFLMYVTAPQNNSRMVNDLGVAAPLSMENGCAEWLEEAMQIYEEDLNSGEKVDWHAFGSFGSFGTEYYIFFTQKIQNLYLGKESVEQIIETTKSYLDATVDTLIIERGWDVSAW